MGKKTIILMTVLLICLFTGCEKHEKSGGNEEDKGNNGLDFTINSNDEGEAAEQDTNINEEEPSHDTEYAFTLNGANIFDLQDTIEIDGIVFKNLKVEIQKKLLQGISKEEITYFYEHTDETGTLEDGYTYIFADITIANSTDKLQVVYLSAGNFVVTNGKNDIIDSTSELRYRSEYESAGTTKKDYNRCELEPGEEKKLLLGYIAPDALVGQETLLYSINLYGTGSGGDDIKAFKVW